MVNGWTLSSWNCHFKPKKKRSILFYFYYYFTLMFWYTNSAQCTDLSIFFARLDIVNKKIVNKLLESVKIFWSAIQYTYFQILFIIIWKRLLSFSFILDYDYPYFIILTLVTKYKKKKIFFPKECNLNLMYLLK